MLNIATGSAETVFMFLLQYRPRSTLYMLDINISSKYLEWKYHYFDFEFWINDTRFNLPRMICIVLHQVSSWSFSILVPLHD